MSEDQEFALTDDDVGNAVSTFQFRDIGQYIAFVFHALRRHAVLAAFTAALILSVTGALLYAWPRTYQVEAKLLARRNDLMTSLSNPGRPSRGEADDPTHAASELIHRHDALLMLIREVGLEEQFGQIRSPLGKVRAAVLRVMGRGENVNEVLAGMLEQRLWLDVDREGVVTIGVMWPEPRTATRIVEVTVQNFIEMRRAQDAAAITEAISILEGSVASVQADVDKTIAKLREERASRPRPAVVGRAGSVSVPVDGARGGASVATTAPADTSIATSALSPTRLVELGRLKERLDAANQEVTRLEIQHRQEIANLERRLANARMIYTENHPTIGELKRSLASASRDTDSEELTSRRAEARVLEQKVNALADQAVAEGQTALVAVQQQLPAQTVPAPTPYPEAGRDTALLAAFGANAASLDLAHPASRLLTLQLAQLANLLDRVNAAHLELATASAGMKYRYTVTRPPEIPKRPLKPNVLTMFALGACLAVIMAMGVAVAADLFGGVLLEPWQLQASLGVPVLATLPADLVLSPPTRADMTPPTDDLPTMAFLHSFGSGER